MESYAKVIVLGSPISKSNFKLFNSNGRAILPNSSGKYHDRYAHYEEEISYCAKLQNPNVVLSESLIAILKVYYKSEKRHPDTNNITKSIFDGIEKSGLIVNDAQIKRLVIEEYYDSKNPRFELELFGESRYELHSSVQEKPEKSTPIIYDLPANRKRALPKKTPCKKSGHKLCEICGKAITNTEAVSANNGKIIICKSCFKKLF